MLTHANWSRQNGERGHAEQDVTLYDVSPDNDWSEVKVWYRDSDGLGSSIYPVDGLHLLPTRKPAARADRAQPRLCRRADRRLRAGGADPLAARVALWHERALEDEGRTCANWRW